MTVADKRSRACAKLIADVHAITAEEGITPSALHAIKLKLVSLASKKDLFPQSDFEMPVAQRRNHPLLVEDNDGHGLYLTINLPGKGAAPHDMASGASTSLSPAASATNSSAAPMKAASPAMPRW